MCVKRALSIIFGSMMEKMREGRRKLHNENTFSSQTVIMVKKSTGVR
jgi:hypothetical protein